MNIIILGAGDFGCTLAEYLLTEKHDITVVDNNPLCLYKIQNTLDVRVISGYASYPDVLMQAGLNKADVLIAATGSDEVNILACQISCFLFPVRYQIVRLHAIEYINQANIIFSINRIPMNVLICSEQLIVSHFFDLIKYPGTLKNMRLYNDQIILSIVKFCSNSFFIDLTIDNIKKHISNIPFIIPIIIRKFNLIFPSGSTIIEKNDEVFFITFSKDLSSLINQIKKNKKCSQYIMIVGGGKIGFHLANALEKKHYIKLIEFNKKRAEEISMFLKKTTVLLDQDLNATLLFEENIDKVDIFIAVTDNNEVNILSGMLAKKMGAKKVIVLTNNKSYIDLFIRSDEIDIIVFSKEQILSKLLSYIGNSNIINRYLLQQHSNLEIIEIVINNNNINSNIIGFKLNKIRLPSDIIIISIIKNNIFYLKNANYVIENNDHIIVLSTNHRSIKEIAMLF